MFEYSNRNLYWVKKVKRHQMQQKLLLKANQPPTPKQPKKLPKKVLPKDEHQKIEIRFLNKNN